jgi:hypothetical protein
LPAAKAHADHIIDLDLAAGTFAQAAGNAGRQIDGDGGMGIIMQIQSRLMRGVVVAFTRLGITAARNADLVRPVPEFRRRIGPVIAGRHIGCQQFEHHGARFFDPLASTVNHHAFARFADAGGRQRAFTLDLADTGAAIAVGPIAGLVEMTQMRD